MYGEFFLLEGDNDEAVVAQRLELGKTAGRNEAWLRDTLFKYPEILPIRDIDPSFGPLIPLCVELRTEAGPIDIAFINRFGQLTLVECKLWRNPEARRKVVAQVLDYVRAISSWSYADFQRQVSAATGRKGNVPYQLVASHFPEIEEQRFVDETHAAIKAGRFLILIAGDGIRKDVGAMAQLINTNAASGFTFGLVEVALYGLDNDRLCVQPRVIAKTNNIERTVFLVKDSQTGDTVIADEHEPIEKYDSSNGSENGGEKHEEYRRWWKPILEMEFDDPEQVPPRLFYPNNVRIALPWPNTWILLYCLASGNSGICTAGKQGHDQRMVEQLEPDRDEILNELPEGAEYTTFNSGEGFTFRTERPKNSFNSEDELKTWLIDCANKYVNALRHRIANLVETEN